ncbi:hypothetical protein [Paraburkholderia sediminicola]|uniref:hypothetical protein n=1 Tax=Paraburkholderia sediminicola TaxID=458836 RepID=UPI0038B9CC1A
MEHFRQAFTGTWRLEPDIQRRLEVRAERGLGFHLTLADLPGMRSSGTGDWAGVFNSYYWIDRSKGIGAVLMAQLLPFFDMPVIETLMGFETAVYQQVGAALPAA